MEMTKVVTGTFCFMGHSYDVMTEHFYTLPIKKKNYFTEEKKEKTHPACLTLLS